MVSGECVTWPSGFCNCGPDQTTCGGLGCGMTNCTATSTYTVVTADANPRPLFDDLVGFHWSPGQDDRPRGRQLAAAPSQRTPWREYARVRH